jgi:O-antigen/teichoic acid export membrane protein
MAAELLASVVAERPTRNAAVLLGGNIVKLGFGFVASALTYRALRPSDAGRFAIAMGLVSLFSFVAEFGFRDAAVNYIAGAATAAEAEGVARSFLMAKVLFGTIAAALLATLAGSIVNGWYGGAVQPGLVRLAALSLLTGGLLNYLQTVLEARQRFGALSLIGVAQALLRGSVIVALFVTGRLGLWPLVGIEVALPLVLLVVSRRALPAAFRPRLLLSLGAHFGRLWRFTRWVAIAAIASTIFLSLDVLLLGHFRDAAEVGLYGAALALVAKFEVVQNAILTSTFPEACRYRTRAELRGYVARTLRLTGLASLGFLVALPLSGLMIVALYGQAYASATIPFALLLLGLAVGLNAQPAAFVLYPLGRPQWIAGGDVLQLVFFGAIGLLLVPHYGAVGIALAVLLRQLLGAGLTAVFVTRLLR